jgi:hypothetical protein
MVQYIFAVFFKSGGMKLVDHDSSRKMRSTPVR